MALLQSYDRFTKAVLAAACEDGNFSITIGDVRATVENESHSLGNSNVIQIMRLSSDAKVAGSTDDEKFIGALERRTLTEGLYLLDQTGIEHSEERKNATTLDEKGHVMNEDEKLDLQGIFEDFVIRIGEDYYYTDRLDSKNVITSKENPYSLIIIKAYNDSSYANFHLMNNALPLFLQSKSADINILVRMQMDKELARIFPREIGSMISALTQGDVSQTVLPRTSDKGKDGTDDGEGYGDGDGDDGAHRDEDDIGGDEDENRDE